MAVQGEQGQEGLDMDLEMIESMAQDEMTVQDIPIMQVNYSPQINAESEMGAAAEAAVYDTPLPSSVKIPPQSPADLRPIVAKRLPQTHPTWASYLKFNWQKWMAWKTK